MLSYPLLGPFSPFLVALGVLLVTLDIASLLSGWADCILLTRGKGALEPVYGIARTLAARGKFAEAEAEYEKIIQEFPNDVQSHIDMINIAVVRLNDGDLAEKLFTRGTSFLKRPADREKLSEAYNRAKTRLKKEEDTSIKTVAHQKLDKIRAHWEEKRRLIWR